VVLIDQTALPAVRTAEIDSLNDWRGPLITRGTAASE
jgi:hypothetical protein